MNILDFKARKRAGSPISMLTCYDYTFARLLNQSDVDVLLVGDSLAMVVHGHPSTVHADVPMMAMHTQAVRRGAPDKFIVADMPFLSARAGIPTAMEATATLMRAGANAVKIEGERGQLDVMAHIVESGVPVMGHLGLTPQSVEALGGHRVQGRSEGAAVEMLASARRLEAAGCFSLVLECVPSALARTIAEALSIPVIGIGAGVDTDGQVLVLHDMLGMNETFKPRFLRHYATAHTLVREAANHFHVDVQERAFPAREESYA
ncbi:MAG: 3-methyl-2-oxobutanoate hydroxymethyltransferase [Pseudomonadales bacterium]|nr:3-methyl-2-oxobutanoate hydroxymethyltransferase [Pseudomonadales bacterium]